VGSDDEMIQKAKEDRLPGLGSRAGVARGARFRSARTCLVREVSPSVKERDASQFLIQVWKPYRTDHAATGSGTYMHHLTRWG
jgi:hypothetical protein